MRKYTTWIIVALVIGLNHYFRYLLQQSNGHAILNSLPLMREIQYSAFLTQKWPLVILSFLLLGYWLSKQKVVFARIRENISYISIIAFVLLVSHLISFQRWFEFDDYRVIGTHFAVTGTDQENTMGLGNSVFYGIGMVYLVVRWFGSSFELYNILGLLIYFLIGVTIFAFFTKLQKNKLTALLAALFFITSPTYWRQTLQMQEFIGDGFSTLLFALTNLQLIFGFYPGAVLSAAATLEFGLSRTHFIGLPLFLLALLLSAKQKPLRLDRWLAIISFPVITLLYLSVFVDYFPESVDGVSWSKNFGHLLRIADSIFAVSIPHGIAFPLVWFFRWLLSTREHISYILGSSIILFLLILSLYLFRKGKLLSAKLIFVGTIIIGVAISLPTLSGIRIIQNLKDLTIQYDDIYPTAPTSYGIFSTFGMMFVVVGLGQIIQKKLFRNIVVALIVFNALTLMKSDLEWAKKYSTPQRAANPQLANLIPEDGKVKVIFTKDILARYVDLFYQIYRIKEPLYIQNDEKEFVNLIRKYKPNTENVYVFVMNTDTYKITDLSQEVRNSVASGNLTPKLLGEIVRR